MELREKRIRDRFQADLERYRFLTSDAGTDEEPGTDEEQADPG